MTVTPREIDEALASVWCDIYTAKQHLASNATTLQSMAGAQFNYVGKQRVTDMTADQAEAILRRIVDDNTAESDYAPILPRRGYNLGQARRALAELAELRTTLERLHQRENELEATYTGWSRFFLVTSSNGHIHSTMWCPTCKPRTTYAWQPDLSGKTEAEAVEKLGPTLCSFCFRSAPVHWTTGRKITAAQAARIAAQNTPQTAR